MAIEHHCFVAASLEAALDPGRYWQNVVWAGME
jgi:hypothetical protein